MATGDETPHERAARWAAEQAEVKPRSKVLGAVLGEGLPRLLGLLVVVVLLGGIAWVAWSAAHRNQPGGKQAAGLITATSCFADDPTSYIASGAQAATLPTAKCEDSHKAEAFLSLKALPADEGGAQSECESGWADDSDIPLSTSGIHISVLVRTSSQSVEETLLCVAVGPEAVKGRSLATWKPS